MGNGNSFASEEPIPCLLIMQCMRRKRQVTSNSSYVRFPNYVHITKITGTSQLVRICVWDIRVLLSLYFWLTLLFSHQD